MKKINISSELKLIILKRDNFRCAICRYSAKINGNNSLQFAHIWPEAKGGLTEKENLLLLCANCHTLLDNMKAFWFDPDTGNLICKNGLEINPKFSFSQYQAEHIKNSINRGNLDYRAKFAQGIL